MPRYFFNVYDGVDIVDRDGTMLADKREMRVHMMAMTARLFEDEASFGDGVWQMEAVDEDGKIVGTIEFGLAANSK